MAAWLEVLAEARHQAETLGNVVRALELAAAAWAGADAEGRLHLRRFCDWLSRRVTAQHDPATLRRRVALPEALSCEPPSVAAGPEPAVGCCGALLVDRDQSGAAFVARVVIDAAPDTNDLFPPDVGASFREAVAAAERAVLGFLRRRHRWRPRETLRAGTWLRLEGPPAVSRYRTDGGSVGAAAAVAFYSRWTETPVEGELLVTGDLAPDGRLLPVGSLEEKIRAALRERPRARKVLVPASQQPPGVAPPVAGVPDLEALLVEAFGEEATRAPAPEALDIEGAVRKGVELYEKANDFEAAVEVLGEALAVLQLRRRAEPGCFRVEEFTAEWRLGSALIHQGRVDEALERLRGAEALGEELWRRAHLSPEAYLGLRGNLAVLLRDVYRYAEAEALLHDTLRRQRELHQDARQVAKTLGNLGELWTFTGNHAAARQVLEEALEGLGATSRDEVPRAWCHLGNLALARGLPREALDHYARGLQANAAVVYGRPRNEGFLRYGAARAHLALGQPEEVMTQAEPALRELPPGDPYPRQLILACTGLARLIAGRVDDGTRRLEAAADLTYVRGPLLRFGVSTALAHRVLMLPRGAAIESAWITRLGRLVEALRAVPGLAAGPGLADRLTRLLERGEARASELRPVLVEAVGWFPYGIPAAGAAAPAPYRDRRPPEGPGGTEPS